jgi:hypothetical protein
VITESPDNGLDSAPSHMGASDTVGGVQYRQAMAEDFTYVVHGLSSFSGHWTTIPVTCGNEVVKRTWDGHTYDSFMWSIYGVGKLFNAAGTEPQLGAGDHSFDTTWKG